MSANIQQESKGFFPFIHIIRGVAPVFVMWSHLVGLWIYETGTHWEPWVIFYNYVMLPFHVYQGLGHLGVILFFLISGFVISYVAERETRFEFLIKRLFRIMPPLVVAVLVLGILNRLLIKCDLPLISGTNSTIVRDYILTATLLDRLIYTSSYSLSVTWTLVTEFWFYGFILILMPILKKNPMGSTVALLIMFMIISAPVVVVPYFSASASLTIYIPVFVIGRLVYLMDQNRISGAACFSLGSAAAMLFLAVNEAKFPGAMWGGPIIKAFTYPTALFIFLGIKSMDIRKTPRVLKFFGDISYSLYLLHLPIGFFVLLVTSDHLGYTSSLILAIAATIIASWLSFRLVEKSSQSAARKLIKWIA